MKNLILAQEALRCLAELGVADICVCAGRRDAPLVVLLERQRGFQVHSFFEERSAAFFALGRAKRTGRPAAIVTTSGTAAAELLPAFIEAHYSGHRLVAVTADRPRRLRGTGAPQTIDQVGLFGPYVERTLDIEAGERWPSGLGAEARSIHLNLCFDEPLIDGAPEGLEFAPAPSAEPQPVTTEAAAVIENFIGAHHRPLVIAGPLKSQVREGVARFIGGLGAPALLEGASGLRGAPELASFELRGGNRFISQLLASRAFDSVVRIGGVPSARCWRDLDESLRDVPVLNISALPFLGLGRGEMAAAPLSILDQIKIAPKDRGVLRDIIARDRAVEGAVVRCIESEPRSEAALIRELSRWIPSGAAVYLGNSLPIREWDLGAVREKTWADVDANRGANGIDGQLSSFFGWSFNAAERWCVVGDLTTLYDLSAPSCAPAAGATRIVVVNNGGGQIFRRMFSESLFRNEHVVSFAGWAAMWGFDHQIFDGAAPFPAHLPHRVVIEVRPDAEAGDRMWAAYDAMG